MSYQQYPQGGYAPPPIPPHPHQQQQPQQPQQPQHQQFQQQQQYPPPPPQPQGNFAPPAGGPLPQSDSGAFHGGNYSVTHRDTNAVLTVDLQQGAIVRS